MGLTQVNNLTGFKKENSCIGSIARHLWVTCEYRPTSKPTTPAQQNSEWPGKQETGFAPGILD